MKKTLLYILSLLTLSLLAQDGINYQGAATDANGDELTNQNISIRASVLSTSANGNLEWEETHSTTTDQFGLFNIVIGQGTNTTNGATALFDDMDWGGANHFLKIEMDATGGTNYAMIGTTQMMSVPYALYAKSANIDYDSISNMIANSGYSSNSYGGFIPSWVYNTGSCASNLPGILQSSNDSVSNGNMSLNGDYSFCNFTLNANDTLTINGDYLILRVADTLTINGVIDGIGRSGSTTIAQGVSGGNGGFCSIMNTYNPGQQYPGVSISNMNGIEISLNGSAIQPNHLYSPIITGESLLSGVRGGSGGCRYYNGNNPGVIGGGDGGSGLILICKYLVFNGEISLNGGNGLQGNVMYNSNSSQNAYCRGASGGGGGGSIIINAEQILTNTGIINQNGGLGGSSYTYVNPYPNSIWWGSANSANNGGDGFILWLGDQ